ncbi:hypothetical protein [Pseudomonas entomophila]|uniref:hypothetical protein n=1 Tax=Pseudomonas entomophila TaxID=312306 RepID=UPI001F01B7E4|nr:hypothetical protein [Pseudomonas entomophila]MCG8291457.1 hypothetical protein [Pseudomonas entomophila]
MPFSPVGNESASRLSQLPGASEPSLRGAGVMIMPHQASVADKAAIVGGAQVQQQARNHVLQQRDRSREAELKALNNRALAVKPVEATHMSEAVQARAREELAKKPNDLAQLRAASDQVAGRVAELDKSGFQWPDQADQDAVRLGLRLNQLVDGPEVDPQAVKKVVEDNPPGAPRLIMNIREVFNYIRLKYPNDPLDAAVLKVLREFARDLGAFKNEDKRQTRAADNVRYRRALAGVMLARLIQKGIGELLDGLFAGAFAEEGDEQ